MYVTGNIAEMQQDLCESVHMSNTKALEWELGLSGRVGQAVLARRKALGMSAVRLSARTAEFGYPITRVTLSKIENNARAGKIEIAEVLVLAAALDIPPVLLLLPDYPFGQAELLPGVQADGDAWVRWIAGASALRPTADAHGVSQVRQSNPGIALVEAAAKMRQNLPNIATLRNIESLSDSGLAAELPPGLQALTEAVTTALRADLAGINDKISEERGHLWGIENE